MMVYAFREKFMDLQLFVFEIQNKMIKNYLRRNIYFTRRYVHKN